MRAVPLAAAALALTVLAGDALADKDVKTRKMPMPSAAAQMNVMRRTRDLMGTTCEIVIAVPAGTEEGPVLEAFTAAFDEMQRVEALMTTWRPDSTVSKINAAAGKGWVAADPETLQVLEKSQWSAKLSGGAFDITVGTFKGLWKFDQDVDGSIPSAADIQLRLKHVGWKKLQIRAGKVRISDPKTLITLGGSAKGYAVDRAVATLRGRGYRDFIVQAGGDLFVSGDRGDRSWQVGIKDPRGSEPFAAINIKDMTFSTSGDYERFVIKDGKRYHHILDPKTGYPVAHTRSVTVLAKDALTADAVDTMLFVVGAEKGMEIAKLAGVEAVWVTAKNEVVMTPGLKGRLQILRTPTP